MTFNKNLVSVVMSCFNSEQSVTKAIESILNQSYESIELLIVDDGSTDGTFNKLNKFSKKYNNIKVYKNTNNIGLTKSLNFLIDESKGQYIARQDSDDISLNYRIQKQVELLESYDLDFCSTRARIINSTKKIPRFSEYLPKRVVMKIKNPFIHGTLLIKKSTLLEVGKYNENFYYAQDYRLMKDLLEMNYKFKSIREPLYELNMINNISNLKIEKQNYYANCVKKNIKPNLIK
tara:strand:+ start:19567 stop:20268 length:702 start_codon:yes stop_codon:yes gene_type:complete